MEEVVEEEGAEEGEEDVVEVEVEEEEEVVEVDLIEDHQKYIVQRHGVVWVHQEEDQNILKCMNVKN